MVKTEIKYITDDNRTNCRLDIVVFDDNDKPLFIVENKAKYRGKGKPKQRLKQIERYKKKTGLPVYLIRGMEKIPEFLDHISKDFDVLIPDTITLNLKQ